MSTLNREDDQGMCYNDKPVQTQSTHSNTQESAHSFSSSLMTDEDWDAILAKEQHQIEEKESERKIDAVAAITVIKSPYASPEKVRRSQYSTPSSPSELLRLTTRNPAAITTSTKTTSTAGARAGTGGQVEEAKQFEKELGDWINNDYSPFEGSPSKKALTSL